MQQDLVSQIVHLSLSPQHPAFRGHCVHVPVPRRRQVHVPFSSSEERGHEQQWGQKWDLGGRRLYRKQRHINLQAWGSNHWGWLMGKMWRKEGKTESRLVHLHWANAKVYHIVPLEQRKLCTTQRIYLTLFCPFLFQVCIKKPTSIFCVTSFEIIQKRYPIINYLRNVVTSLI